jgi:hypothetical protein
MEGIAWGGAMALGIMIGYVLHKYLSGIADVEADAFVNGYAQGYRHGWKHLPQRYAEFDSPKYRKSHPNSDK